MPNYDDPTSDANSVSPEPPPSARPEPLPLLSVEDVEKSLSIIQSEGSWFEIRILKASRLSIDGHIDPAPRTYYGFFSSPHLAVAALSAALTGATTYSGVYVTLNPVRPELASTAANVLRRAERGTSTGDGDVLSRRWLLIDLDPCRASNVSSTEAEHDAARTLAGRISAALTAEGWPEPVVCDSGNGAHLLYSLDCPADDSGLVKRVLERLAERFDSPMVKVDRGVDNPARISKVYGTLACKGENTLERPHRGSSVLSVPVQLATVDPELLEVFAGSERPAPAAGRPSFDIEAWLLEHKVSVGPSEPWLKAGRRWVLPVCPFNPDHNRGEAVVGQLPSGAVYFKCQHNSCRDNRWRAFRALFEAKAVPPPGSSVTCPSGSFPLTDSGNADRLEAQYGESMRYCIERGKWHIWDGTCWIPDDSGLVYDIALTRIREIPMREVPPGTASAVASAINGWAKTSESKTKLDAAIGLSQKRQGLVIRSKALDADDWKLNVGNGTIDLRSGELLPHSPSRYCSKIIDTAYDPAGKAPLWERFLDEVMGGDQEMVAFLQRAVGYSLTGSTREQCLFILWGTGANGKSTFLTILRKLFAVYAAQMAPSTMQVRKDNNARSDIARLDGVRLVLSSETGDGGRLDEALVKQMTGGDPLVARYLYQNDFEFIPKFKIFLATNRKPEIQGAEEGIWRRIRLVPFDVTIPEGKRDPDLLEKLQGEFPGILAWAVQGCVAFLSDGLRPPTRVTEATQEYRTESDVLSGFLDARCVLGANEQVTVKQLYEAYAEYCTAYSEQPLARGTLTLNLKNRGIKSVRSSSARSYVGIGLLRTETGASGLCVPEKADVSDEGVGVPGIPVSGASFLLDEISRMESQTN